MLPIDISKYQQLFFVSDELRKTVRDPKSRTPVQIISTINYLCNQLNDVNEEEFGKLGDFLSKLSDEPNVQEIQNEIIRDAKKFASFLRFEYQILRSCGASIRLAKETTVMFSIIREQLGASEVNLHNIAEDFYTFKKNVCLLGSELREREISTAKFIEMEKHYYSSMGFLSSFANGSFTAITLGAAAPSLVLSGTLGGYLLHKSARMENPMHKRIIDHDGTF